MDISACSASAPLILNGRLVVGTAPYFLNDQIFYMCEEGYEAMDAHKLMNTCGNNASSANGVRWNRTDDDLSTVCQSGTNIIGAAHFGQFAFDKMHIQYRTLQGAELC